MAINVCLLMDDDIEFQVLFWPPRDLSASLSRAWFELRTMKGGLASRWPWMPDLFVPYQSTSLSCNFLARCELRPDPCPDLE